MPEDKLTIYDTALAALYISSLAFGVEFLSLPWPPVLAIICAGALLFVYYSASDRRRPGGGLLYRKVLHVAGGTFLAAITIIYGPGTTIYLALTLLLAFALYELMRWRLLRRPIFLSHALAFFGDPEEFKGAPFKEALLGLLGVLSVLSLFDQKAALCGILTLSLGDGISGLVGFLMKTRPLPFNRRKTVGGLLAGFAASSVAVLLALGDLRAIAGPLFGMFAEALSSELDNFLVPASSALACSIALQVKLIP